jgi:predicted nuclease of predicted toxin-antitoxin system
MMRVDAQLSPALAPWIAAELGHPANAVRDLGLRAANDPQIFQAAREAQAIVPTKDADFAGLVERMGPSPQIIWITCGNTSNAAMRDLLRRHLPKALQVLAQGEPLIEITGPA